MYNYILSISGFHSVFGSVLIRIYFFEYMSLRSIRITCRLVSDFDTTLTDRIRFGYSVPDILSILISKYLIPNIMFDKKKINIFVKYYSYRCSGECATKKATAMLYQISKTI